MADNAVEKKRAASRRGSGEGGVASSSNQAGGGGKKKRSVQTTLTSTVCCKRLRIDAGIATERAGGAKQTSRRIAATSVTPSSCQPSPPPARARLPVCSPTASESSKSIKGRAASKNRSGRSAAADASKRGKSIAAIEEARVVLPDGVIDLDSAPYVNQRAQTHEEALEASYLAAYGKDYYCHLFESDRQRCQGSTPSPEVVPSTPSKFSGPRTVTMDSDAQVPETPSDASRGEGADGGTAAVVPPFLSDQPHITPNMREVLVDWLAELSHSYRLTERTLHLAVRLVDRTLRRTAEAISQKEEDAWVLQRGDFQCLGCACLLIASKLEETHPIGTKDLVFMSDNTYTKDQIHQFEQRVCDLLEFRLCGTTSHHFAERFVRASDTCAGCRRQASMNGTEDVLEICVSPRNPRLSCMVSYLLELSLLLPELSPESGNPGAASLSAAAALFLARATLGVRDHRGQIWSEALIHYTGYEQDSLESTVKALHKCQCEADSSDLGCIHDRYSKKDRMQVALKPALCVEDIGFAV